MIRKDILIDLYSKGKSMMEIAHHLKCSDSEVRYWMKKYKIKRRSHSEATYLKANPNGDPFEIKIDLTPKDNFLLGLGLGIFWGEGTKVNKNSVRVANSNPKLILIFRRFLIEICGVSSNKFQYAIVCFNNSSPRRVLKYWSKQLNVPEENFTKVVQIPSQGKGSYKRKSSLGVCTIIVNNLKLKAWIDNKLAEL